VAIQGKNMEDIQGIEDLLIKATAGNETAENELFSKLHARFLNIAQHRIWSPTSDNRKEAEDIVQNSMETILEKYKTMKYQKGFLNWTFGILRNKIGDYFRRKKRISVIDNNIKDLSQQDPSSDELKNVIIESLNKLPMECKKILWFLIDGYSVKEIINMFLGENRNKIDSKIHRCRKNLKRILDDGGYLNELF
jgi:RNA polymerase sigma factor (sigma-70 family)